MEEVKRKTRELEASVLSLANEPHNAHIRQLFNQFQQALGDDTPGDELSENEDTCSENSKCYSVEDELEVNGNSDVEEDVRLDVSPSNMLEGSSNEDDVELWCKICEVQHSLTHGTDYINPFDTFDKPSNPTGDEVITYPDWGYLTEHVQKDHCQFDTSRIEKDGMSVNDNRLFSAKGVPVNALRVITKYQIIICPRCKKELKISTTYKEGYMKMCIHLNTKHRDEMPDYLVMYDCNSCNYTTYSKKLHDYHMEYNHSGRKMAANQKVACVVCDKQVLQRYLVHHMAVKHDINPPVSKTMGPVKPKKIKCRFCPKEIVGTGHMTRHVERVHLEIKNHLCHICSKGFYENKGLVYHMYDQHGLNIQNKDVIHCQVPGCDFSTLSSNTLSQHKIIKHSEGRQFICSQCSKGFKTKYNLKQHESVSHTTTSSNFYCPTCTFRSHSQHYLRRHMKTHSEHKKHKCQHPGCTYQSHYSENVKKHTKRMHSGLPSRRKGKPRKSATTVTESTLTSTTSGTVLTLSNEQIDRDQVQQQTAAPTTMPYYNTIHETAPNYHTIVLTDMKSCQPPTEIVNKSQNVIVLSLNSKPHPSENPGQQDLLSLSQSAASNSETVYQCSQIDTSDITNHSNSFISL